LDNTYFKISEIEADFEYFNEKVIPKIETTVMKMIAWYCMTTKSSLSSLFFSEDGKRTNFADTMTSSKGMKKNMPEEINYTPDVHMYTLYSVEEKVSDLIQEKADMPAAKDYRTLFKLYALVAASVDDRTNIPFSHIYRMTKDSRISSLYNFYDFRGKDDQRDEDINDFVLRDSKIKLMRYLAEK